MIATKKLRIRIEGHNLNTNRNPHENGEFG
jgi:hypothetical protein